MKNAKIRWTAAGLAALCAVAAAIAQSPSSPPPSVTAPAGQSPPQGPIPGRTIQPPKQAPPANPAQTDRYQFATDAWSGNMAEVSLARLAQKKNCNSQVRDFANRLIEDHTKANQQLKNKVGNSVPLPTALTPKYQDMYNRLAALSCPDFDKVYMNDMVNEHKADIAMFKKEASSGADPVMKQYARDTVPTLNEHLQLAQKVQNAVGLPGPGVAAASHPGARSRRVESGNYPVRNVSDQDLTFVNNMGASDQAQIQFGELAAGKAYNKNVKQLATEMVPEFRHSLDELKKVLPKGITLPGDLNDTAKATRERLRTLEGEGFDFMYVQQLDNTLRNAVGLLEQESTSGNDPNLKSYAAKMLPTTRQKYQKVQKAAAAVKKQ